MAWADVPAKLAQLDAEEYTDDTQGTTNSAKLIAEFTNGKSFDENDILPGEEWRTAYKVADTGA